ncbi:BSD domain-containing protein C22A12.14c-like [Vicia villosa]|uniref:BSD domain-containing protein C22A12.14c-like n=1 Tax=Vicia villosa TaxID=3911 RepID=UPI00273C69EF|nr:BSD domain-containing protein C22A12.14c-like [Vicia villosa]
MNFFKSVFSDDPDPPQSEPNNANPNSDPDSGSGAGDAWNFGGLIKTLTTKSESIIETYRRDLQEFSTGLKSEIEVAHDSVGEIGSTVIKSTAQIISQGKEAILAVNLDSDSDNGTATASRDSSRLDTKRYSRFDAQVGAMQGDVSTYTEVPEDLNEFNEWKLGFELDGKSDEMESLFRENDAMESVYKKVVPNDIDHETFWYRYYYKVYRLKKAEDVRARLVRRISKEEEFLSWDVEDDDEEEEEEEEENEGKVKPENVINKEIGGENLVKSVDADLKIAAFGSGAGSSDEKRLSVEEVQHSGSKVEKIDNSMQSNEHGNETGKSVEESPVVEKAEVVREMGGGSEEKNVDGDVDKASKLEVGDAANKNSFTAASNEKVILDEKVVMLETKSSDVKSLGKNKESSSVVESQPMENEEEEDLGWDDIEDLSSIDDKKGAQSESQSGSTSKVDLLKCVSTAEEDEDLSWDIEEDDEPVKP